MKHMRVRSTVSSGAMARARRDLPDDVLGTVSERWYLFESLARKRGLPHRRVLSTDGECTLAMTPNRDDPRVRHLERQVDVS